MNESDLKSLLQRPIAFHRAFVPLGGVAAAVMLSQAKYWSERTADPDGWFYKTQAEWEAETGLTRREQETARKKLKGVLLSELRGVPAKLYYRVDYPALAKALQFGGMRHTCMSGSDEQDVRKAPNIPYAETTSEITTEITNGSAGADGKPSNQPLFPETEPPQPVDPPKERDSEPSPRKVIFSLGVNLLKGQGMNEQQARRFLGKWTAEDEQKLAGIIGQAAARETRDAKAFIVRCMKGGGKITTVEQAKKAAVAENVPQKKGDTFEHLRDRIYQYREERLNGEAEKQTEGAT